VEIEALADAWYVWVAVAVVSIAVAGTVLALPAEPPPDAGAAANAADRVAASDYGTAVSYEHAADRARFGTRQISLRNEAGSDHASVSFEPLTPVTAADGELRRVLEALLAGEDPEVVASETRFGSQRRLREALADLRRQVDRDGAEWHRTDGPVRVRSVRLAGETVVLIGVRPASASRRGNH
jgi:hypothetical protein